MMTLPLVCPTCSQPLHQHEASKGFYCEAKHHFDRLEQGYYPLVKVKAKTPQSSISRQQMRARQFLLQSGVFQPLVDALQQKMLALTATAENELNWLDYQCGDGFYLTQIHQYLMTHGITQPMAVWGVSDAENALFAASKGNTPASLIFCSTKVLPFANQSMDVVTLFDAPIKGQECLRVLKDAGRIVLVQPSNQHLWQIKQHVYPDLVEKPSQLNIPKRLLIESQQQVSFEIDVTGDQAVNLLDSSLFAWRANDEIRHQIKSSPISGLKCEFDMIVLKKI
ncbi:putative RNA methyltransferase [Shewanella glacialimarina]|jgi:23S rRNA (guanine745-N1)-methyltransferase|uniref:putative RNA methyltransferase n=1 Tax=Shewanella glacialimarina TaxID=2590884 RepID=UPI001CF85DA0|nr:SAM-dependent methyltransferase [Shewanella glacialimarina]